jgi:DNA gyrase/topoisomerase IV subunit A
MTSSKSEFGFIKPTQIVEEMRSSYLDYAMALSFLGHYLMLEMD